MITWTVSKDRNLIISVNDQEYIIPSSDHRYKQILGLIAKDQEEKILEIILDKPRQMYYNDTDDDMC